METIELVIPDDKVQPLIDALLKIGFQPIADNLIPTAMSVETTEERTETSN